MLKFRLPAGEAKAEAALIRTLTQYGLNAAKFCTEFNQKSLEKFVKGLLVTVYVKLNFENRSGVLTVGLPNLCFYMQAFGKITLSTLFDCYKAFFILQGENYTLEMFFGSLRAFKGYTRLKRKLKKLHV